MYEESRARQGWRSMRIRWGRKKRRIVAQTRISGGKRAVQSVQPPYRFKTSDLQSRAGYSKSRDLEQKVRGGVFGVHE